MPNHPIRSQSNKSALYPTPSELRDARLTAKQTPEQAAKLIYVSPRRWQSWEDGAQPGIHPAFWELYLLKTEQKSLDPARLDREVERQLCS